MASIKFKPGKKMALIKKKGGSISTNKLYEITNRVILENGTEQLYFTDDSGYELSAVNYNVKDTKHSDDFFEVIENEKGTVINESN